MSILIKGMEMPTAQQGYMTVRIYYDGTCVRPNWQGDCTVINGAEAVKVPTPHGRLVDINTILHDGNRGCVDELINDPELSEQIKVGVSAARVIVCSAPTIIEAEE